MSDFTRIPGTDRFPEAVVLLDPVSGMPVSAASHTTDSSGAPFNPGDCAHAYAYNAAMQASATPDAYDFTGGWPAHYV